jgi:hypothetical protein
MVATSGDVHYALRFIETIVASSKSGDFAQLDAFPVYVFCDMVATSGDVHYALCFIETIVESSKSGDFAQRETLRSGIPKPVQTVWPGGKDLVFVRDEL